MTDMKLVHEKTGEEIKVGDKITDFRGETWFLTGMAAPPQWSGSTGRVFVNTSMEDNASTSRALYPSVFYLKFVEKTT